MAETLQIQYRAHCSDCEKRGFHDATKVVIGDVGKKQFRAQHNISNTVSFEPILPVDSTIGKVVAFIPSTKVKQVAKANQNYIYKATCSTCVKVKPEWGTELVTGPEGQKQFLTHHNLPDTVTFKLIPAKNSHV